MRSWWRIGLAVLIVVAVLAPSAAILLGWQPVALLASLLGGGERTVRIGLLHSKTGFLRISEESLLDAEVLAIEEINAAGGVANHRIVWSAPDCQSDPTVFATQARRLIEQEEAVALFGSWSSECRKAILPILDERNSLLFFPGNFEGIEQSKRVVYTGGAANQTVLPAVRWAFDTLKARRFFVVGLDEVWSRCCGEIAKDAIQAAGATTVGEFHSPSLATNIDAIIEAIRQAKPDVVLNFLSGGSNGAFYASIRPAGFTPEKLPVIAFGFSEDESRRFHPADVEGQYAAWNYFQSSNRPENRDFVRRFRARFGAERSVGDAMVAAYNGVKFWAQAVREVGTTDVTSVTNILNRQSMDAADGIVTIDTDSQAVWRPFHLGRVRPGGEQFEVVWSILKPIRPVRYVGTRTAEQWQALLDGFKTQWRGRWSAAVKATDAPPR